MIKNYKRIFNEKFYTSFLTNKGYVEIFFDPSMKEYLSIDGYDYMKTTRAFLIKDHAYVFTANVIHDNAVRYVKEKFLIPVLIYGQVGKEAEIELAASALYPTSISDVKTSKRQIELFPEIAKNNDAIHHLFSSIKLK